MITSLIIALTLLLGASNAQTSTDATQQNGATTSTSTGETTPPPDNEARSHIVDIG